MYAYDVSMIYKLLVSYQYVQVATSYMRIISVIMNVLLRFSELMGRLRVIFHIQIKLFFLPCTSSPHERCPELVRLHDLGQTQRNTLLPAPALQRAQHLLGLVRRAVLRNENFHHAHGREFSALLLLVSQGRQSQAVHAGARAQGVEGQLARQPRQ